jgi:hypothetical protein
MELSLPLEYPSDNPVPESILGYVSVRGARSVFGASAGPLPDSSAAYHAERADRDQVRRHLQESELTIYVESPFGFAVVGSPAAFEDLTGGTVEAKERLMRAEGGRVRYVTHLDVVGDRQPETLGVAYAESEAARIDGVLLERPRIAMGMFPSPTPANSPKFHLGVPADVSALLSAPEAHRQGFSGEDVLVAMPDSGFFRHPYFIVRHYAVKKPITVVQDTDPNIDPFGHGTGESANVFAVAPGAVLQPIRASDSAGTLFGIGGFLKAKELNPRIITNSWGGDGPFPPDGDPDEFERAFALEIMDAIEQGILVVFSAGNSHFSIEPQVPGVLAAGGVHMSAALESRASDYASGYQSPWFDGVTVPTVCGLVGLRPRAQYIMLPVPPGSPIDVWWSQPSTVPFDPTDDGTAPNDGWALFSGTSAAAPQLAGAAALVLGAKPELEPAQVIEALSKTAVDITTGSCHPRFNYPAAIGHDLATGHGLVNAAAALNYAMEEF